MNRQPDLFETIGRREPASPIPDPDAIRARLLRLLAIARAAHTMPWDEQRASVQELVFHNMANWLPEQERDALRSAFAAELARLRGAAAAET